jgi:hypothetical protein
MENDGTSSDFTGRSDPLLADISVLVLTILYGGVHATSWNGQFPSYVEQTMWRLASSVVAGGGVSILVSSKVQDLCDYLKRKTARRKYFSVVSTAFKFVVDMIFAVIILLYCSARLFLVTEAFISLRSPPVGVYDTVDWINFLPHI